MDTLSYHFDKDQSLCQEFGSTWQELFVGLPQSDLDILLTIESQPIWNERMRVKNPTLNDQDIVSKHEQRECIFRLYRELNPRFVQIDNGGSLQVTERRVDKLFVNSTNQRVVSQEVQYV